MQIIMELLILLAIVSLCLQVTFGHPIVLSDDDQDSYATIRPETVAKIEEVFDSFNKSLSRDEVIAELKKTFKEELKYVRRRDTHIGEEPEYAAKSCSEIATFKPCSTSGYYWVEGLTDIVGVYCEMDASTRA